MIEDIKTYNGHTYNSQIELSACINGYKQGRADAINEYRDKLIEAFTPLVEDEWIENETVIADVKLFAEQLKKDNA